ELAPHDAFAPLRAHTEFHVSLAEVFRVVTLDLRVVGHEVDERLESLTGDDRAIGYDREIRPLGLNPCNDLAVETGENHDGRTLAVKRRQRRLRTYCEAVDGATPLRRIAVDHEREVAADQLVIGLKGRPGSPSHEGRETAKHGVPTERFLVTLDP